MANRQQKPKVRQHTVPRSYLERFAVNGVLQCYDKPTQRPFTQSADNVTYQRRFYDIDASDDQSVENWFAAHIEPELNRDLDHFQEQVYRARLRSLGSDFDLGALGIPHQIRSSIAHYMILQNLRTGVERRTIQHAMSKAIASISRLIHRARTGGDPGTVRVEFTQHDLARLQARSFVDPEWVKTAVAVMRYPMAVLLCREKRFYTSDNPVILFHRTECPGWLVPDVEIYFPLSPQTVLAFCNSASFARWDDHLLIAAPDLGDFLNARQVVSSDRQVYSAEPNWEMVRSTLQIFPHLAKADRPRIDVDVPDWFGDESEGK